MHQYNLCHTRNNTYMYYFYERILSNITIQHNFLICFILIFLFGINKSKHILKMSSINTISLFNKKRHNINRLCVYLSYLPRVGQFDAILDSIRLNEYILYSDIVKLTGFELSKKINKNYFCYTKNPNVSLFKKDSLSLSEFCKKAYSKHLFSSTYVSNLNTIMSSKINIFSDSLLVPWNTIRSVKSLNRIFLFISKVDLFNIFSIRDVNKHITPQISNVLKPLSSYKLRYTEYLHACLWRTMLIDTNIIYNMSDKTIKYYYLLYLINRNFIDYKLFYNSYISLYNINKTNNSSLLKYNVYLCLLYNYTNTKEQMISNSFINNLNYLSSLKRDFFNKVIISGKTTFKQNILEQTKTIYLKKMKSI